MFPRRLQIRFQFQFRSLFQSRIRLRFLDFPTTVVVLRDRKPA